MERRECNSIPLSSIHIGDKFWVKYKQLVKNVIIPYQWEILCDQVPDAEPSHCIKNYQIAAKELDGDFHGAVFQDTDVAKWLEAVAYVLSTEPDQELENLADEVIELIGKAQCSDGYINTYIMIKKPDQRWENLVEGHELYGAGHMIEAAVAYYEATGKQLFLNIVSKFADLICDTFGTKEGKGHGYPGHQEIELALVKLYHTTGNKRYLQTAKYFIDQRGVGDNYFLKEIAKPGFTHIFPEFEGYVPEYSQSHVPVREQKTAEGHAVRAVYMYCAMADLAYEYQDEELMKACETIWDNIVHKRMYITGGIGSSGILERFTTDYDLSNDYGYAETCASIGLALFSKRMAAITKDAKYIDVIEKALYNTVLAGIAMDGKSFFYVNPLEVWPDSCIPKTSKEHVKAVRQKWFGVACCPPNIARTLASLGQYIYSKDGDTLYINLYIANESEIIIDESEFLLKLDSKFPYNGNITISLEGKEAKYIELRLRIPEYVHEYTLKVNGQLQQNIEVLKGYAYLNNFFSKDVIEINFKIPARYVRANPKVRADAGKVAVLKGPLVYCFEEADNSNNLAAYYIDTSNPIQEQYREDILGGITVIQCKGKKLTEDNWKKDELYKEQKPTLTDVELTAVPYCYWGNRKTGEMSVWLKEFM